MRGLLVVGVLVASCLAVAPATVAAGPGTGSGAGNGPVVATAATPGAVDVEGPARVTTPNGTNGTLADPANDTLGWEGGRWYNESLSINRTDGLNDSELGAVVNRSMARVERVRRLEFDGTVPVEVISRETYRETYLTDQYANVSAGNRLHQNVKWEALLMVGEDTDAVAVQRRNAGSSVLGFYSPADERIVVVSEDTESPKLNEITLSQELFHALQDQRFNLSSYDQSTREQHNAVDGIVEGDGNFVDYRYERRCERAWDCLLPANGSTGGGSDLHFGIYFVTFQPYSDGPAFVRDIYNESGWDAVNEVYASPPESTEQTIHPEKYRVDLPREVEVADRSNASWRVLDLEGSANYAEFGEAGLVSMFVYPAYETGGRTQIVPLRSFLNRNAQGDVRSFDPLNYSHRYTAGWDVDRLVPYVTDDSLTTNETGYVYETVWDSPTDAEEFVQGYRRLLSYRDAEPVEDHADTYRIPDDSEFGDAFYVNRTGQRVVIVNGPTVADLSAIRAGAAPEVEPPDDENRDDDGGFIGFDGFGGYAADVDSGGDEGSSADGQPGFGLVLAVLAVVGSLTWGLFRRSWE